MAVKQLALLLLGAALLGVATATLEDDQKEELLWAHNHFRSIPDPIATNMAKLEWDNELADLSQFYSALCEGMPNEDRHDQSTEFDFVGENLAATTNYSANLNFTAIVAGWFENKKFFNYYTLTCTDADGNEDDEGEGCTRYTQLMWARTYKIGCGAFRCEELRGFEDIEDESALFVVCDYGPGGGYIGEPPYQTGESTCSACPAELPYCDNNLCADSGATKTRSTEVTILSLLLTLGGISALL